MAAEKKEEEKKPKTPEEFEKAKYKIKGEGNLPVGGKKSGEKGKEKYELKKYELTYDSFGESLEPVYYWILDFLREDMGYEVEKTADFFAAAEASGWLGEMGARRTALEKRVSEILGTLNLVIKSIINLVYDLREFDLRFRHYDDLKSKDSAIKKSAEQSLKTIWLTEVDMKKGAAAINVMVQNLNFIALRDAFMAAEIMWGKTKEETKKKTVTAAEKIDVTDIVRRPLLGRVGEFVDWIYMSEVELRKRYNIEKAYLKSQVAAMQVYTKWARPYLIATQRLMPAEVLQFGAEYEKFGISPAELASPFDVMHTYLEIFGKKAVKTYGKLPEKQFEAIPKEEKIYSCVEVRLGFRASPGGTTERGHYTAKGKVVVQFIPYIFNEKELEELKKLQDTEVLQFIDAMTKETLDAMSKEIEEYTGEKKEQPEEKKKLEIPVIKHIKWTVAQIKKFQEAFKKLGIKMPAKKQLWEIELLKAAAVKKAAKDAWTLYEMYKKTHGMLAW